jgi:hypothetical protein
MKQFLNKLIFSNLPKEPLGHNVLYNQWNNLKDIWNNTGKAKSDAIGTERILKLFLIFIQFLTPSIYFRAFFGSFGKLQKHIGVEFYVFFKLLTAFLILYFRLYEHWNFVFGMSFFLLWAIIMIAESIFYTANLIINDNVLANPHSYKRNIILVIVDYIQLNFDFASIYLACSALKKVVTIDNSSFDKIIVEPLEAVYFSFITSFTIGYGDITPAGDIGKYLAIFQILIFLLLGILVINFYSSQIASNKQK